MRTVTRILKIHEIKNKNIYCVFNNGQHRIINIDKFISDNQLEDSQRLRRLTDERTLNQVVISEGTLSWPNLREEVTLPGGKTIEVDYDLDPVMLYESSVVDTAREHKNRVGDLLKAARKRAGLTQEELARRVGTSKGYISRIENNRSDIEVNTLRRIVEVGLDKRLAIVD